MTSDGAYPDFRTDVFGRVIDGYRCRSVTGGMRCQLYRDHAEWHGVAEHAHGQVGPPDRLVLGGVTYRWDDAGELRLHDGGRLPWCCLFRP